MPTQKTTAKAAKQLATKKAAQASAASASQRTASPTAKRATVSHKKPASSKQPEGVLGTIVETAKDLPGQVGQGIDYVVEKVSDAASAAAKTTGNVVGSVAKKVGSRNKKRR
jgi:hypothetical protein